MQRFIESRLFDEARRFENLRFCGNRACNLIHGPCGMYTDCVDPCLHTARVLSTQPVCPSSFCVQISSVIPLSAIKFSNSSEVSGLKNAKIKEKEQ